MCELQRERKERKMVMGLEMGAGLEMGMELEMEMGLEMEMTLTVYTVMHFGENCFGGGSKVRGWFCPPICLFCS